MKPVALYDDTKYPARMDLARKFLGLVALLCCAIGLAAPSAARGLHLVDHIESPVAVGEVHSHDQADDHENARAANHEAPATSDDRGQDKSGHSHMPSSVSDLSQMPETRSVPRRLIHDESLAAADLPSLTTRTWSPPVRPPRTV
jgi:hypothetical protein